MGMRYIYICAHRSITYDCVYIAAAAQLVFVALIGFFAFSISSLLLVVSILHPLGSLSLSHLVFIILFLIKYLFGYSLVGFAYLLVAIAQILP